MLWGECKNVNGHAVGQAKGKVRSAKCSQMSKGVCVEGNAMRKGRAASWHRQAMCVKACK